MPEGVGAAEGRRRGKSVYISTDRGHLTEGTPLFHRLRARWRSPCVGSFSLSFAVVLCVCFFMSPPLIAAVAFLFAQLQDVPSQLAAQAYADMHQTACCLHPQ